MANFQPVNPGTFGGTNLARFLQSGDELTHDAFQTEG